MRHTYVAAGVIAVLGLMWLGSGFFRDDRQNNVASTLNEKNLRYAETSKERARTRVKARVIESTLRTRNVRLRGRTEHKRTVQVQAEITGRVVERAVERGAYVEEGRLLCRVSTDDRLARLAQAEQAVNKARIEYEGSKRLEMEGFQSRTMIAAAKARLAASGATLTTSSLDLEKIYIRAPFAGIVEATHAEVGDYLVPGSGCATVIDLDPMLVVARVSERDVQQLDIGIIATGVLSDGRSVMGPITFVGQQADPTTRTYRVEVQVENGDHTVRSGITTEVVVPVATITAHKINPSLFALDQTGAIGVRTLGHDNVVEFHRVDVFDDDEDGVWVTGLPSTTHLITVGQELVSLGDYADPVFEEYVPTPLDMEISRELRSGSRAFDSATPEPKPIGVGRLNVLDDV
ncbi:MAG TPA: efflux RND transporter periplasmic adaptor subunit [Gammaproteobacteria bacterium]|nr:efflux RND transporter periplasmic adaptor subunit [Gammaproteobacteria bacterium]